MSSSESIDRTLHRAVERRVFPGAVLMARVAGTVVYAGAAGLAATVPGTETASLTTIYDLASLTKPLATAGAVLCLVQDGALDLDTPVRAILPALEGHATGVATIAQLLSHSAGLPAWLPYYKWVADRDRREPGFLGSRAAREAVVGYIAGQPPAYPVGAESRYSDLGFMLLGLVVEARAAKPLDDYCHTRLFSPMGACPMAFRPTTGGVSSDEAWGTKGGVIAPTEQDSWRNRLLRGEVHDENAYAMGGVAGHAGLFGDAAAVLAISRHWLAGYVGRQSSLRSDLVRRFVTRADVPGSSWALGWDTPSSPSSSGRRFSDRSFGHLGFTGTSLWVDPDCELEVVLLSNRVHPSRDNDAIKEFRPRIHDLIYETFIDK